MHKNFCGWSLESVGKAKVDTKYIVEYINNSEIADKLERTGDTDLFTKKEFDNVEEALTFYLRWYVDESCIILNLWEMILVNGEEIFEQRIEPTGNCKNNLRSVIDNEMKEDLVEYERDNKRLQNENQLYAGFIKRMGKQFEEMFDQYVKEAINNE